jgi:hypothetical protein
MIAGRSATPFNLSQLTTQIANHSDDTKPGKKRTVLDNALKEHSNVFQFARNASARSMLLLHCVNVLCR